MKNGDTTRAKIRQAIISYISAHGYPPTIAEICEMTGIRSKSTVHLHLNIMYLNGMIESDAEPNTPRAIRIPGYRFVFDDENSVMEKGGNDNER